jgi:hypothetical protein
MSLVGRVTLFVQATAADVKSLIAGLSGKVDKVTGKGLSTNDYTSAEKTLVSGLGEYGSQNLFYNAAMRLSMVTGIADGWKLDVPATPGASTGVLSLIASFINADENAQRLTVTGLNAGTLYRSLYNDPLFPAPKLLAGTSITASVYVKGTAGLTLTVYAQAINASGTSIGVTTGTLVALDGTIQRASVTYPNLPAGTVSVQVLYRVYGSATVTGGTVDLGRPQVQTGPLAGWQEDSRTLFRTAWTNLTLNSGFTASTTHPPQFRIVGDEVQLRGKFTMAAMAGSGTLYPFVTMGVGYRPLGMTTDTEALRVPVVSTSNVNLTAHVAVTRVGVVSIVLGGGLLSSSSYDLSGARWSVSA